MAGTPKFKKVMKRILLFLGMLFFLGVNTLQVTANDLQSDELTFEMSSDQTIDVDQVQTILLEVASVPIRHVELIPVKINEIIYAIDPILLEGINTKTDIPIQESMQACDPPALYTAGVLPDMLPEGIIWLLGGVVLTFLLGKLNIIKFKAGVVSAEGINEKAILVLDNLRQTLENLKLPGAAKFIDELDDIPIEMRDVFIKLRTEILDGDVSVSDLKSIFLESKDVFKEVKELIATKEEEKEENSTS